LSKPKTKDNFKIHPAAAPEDSLNVQDFPLLNLSSMVNINRYIEINASYTDFPNNAVETSKYTCLSFIPKNIIEQFSKIPNVYFLVSVLAIFHHQIISFLQTIDEISTSKG